MQQNQTPKVTVLMPVYNGEKYLREAIDSILHQTFIDFEFLIIDDGSTDNSIEIIKSYKDNRIILIKNNYNQGLVYSLNRGLNLARGIYIARMDCDDISLPERFKKQVDFLDKNPEIGLLGTWVKVIDKNKLCQAYWQYPIEDMSIKWSLCFCCPFAHPSVMYRKKIILNQGGYSKILSDSEDYDLWSKLSKVTQMHNLPEIALFYRQHASNITKTQNSQRQSASTQIIKKNINEILNRDIGYELAYFLLFRNTQNYEKAQKTASIIYEIYYVFKKINNNNNTFLIYLNTETAIKIFSFLRPYLFRYQSWPLLIKSLALDPLFILRILQRKIKQSFKC
ncbi:glycosyltransferase [Synechocystis sp. FACHB-383]|uniref:glycosyltransferase n=1 Tax=Synechocystis sp. FACHB-383 TaxID=2692864 RepID=UPI0016860487|nr:glycosyltransferase [Synechocystis sp. FACHB-383]MBD2655385.1 glycosyltransferase [Synechocystis sp. FACHB-383]